MAISKEEIEQIARKTADEIIERVYGIPELGLHIAEHEVMGGARVIDKAKAENPSIPGKCFSYDGDEFCWKPGYLGLISSKKNPEQLATVKIKIPAGTGVVERFKAIKGAIGEAHQEWEKSGTGLRGWWQRVGEEMEKQGVAL